MKRTYAVVLHTSGEGYVVRTVYDGWLPRPYTDATRVAEYRREADAWAEAERLNIAYF